MLSDGPSIREDHEVDICSPLLSRGRGHHGEYRGIGVIEEERTYWGEGAEVILVRSVVSVPRNHVERRVVDSCLKKLSTPLHDYFTRRAFIFVGSYWGFKIARVREAIRADRSTMWKGKLCAVVLAEVAT